MALKQDALEQTAAQLLSAGEVAQVLGVSTRHVSRLSDAGRMPAPVKLGALVRWSRQAIMDWIEGGCPEVGHPEGEPNNE